MNRKTVLLIGLIVAAVMGMAAGEWIHAYAMIPAAMCGLVGTAWFFGPMIAEDRE